MGKMPEALAAAAASSDVILACEGLPVWNRVWSLRIPGAKVGGGSRSASGAIVILPSRLLASVGKYPIVDSAFGAEGGSQELTLSSDGVRIKFEVATVLPGGTGTMQLYFRVPLDESLLGQLPTMAFSVTLSHAAEALLYPWHGSYAGGARAAAG
jgi:hypothetical protein